MSSPLKSALEDLLRSRKLQADGPPLRGERRLSPLSTGLGPIDALLNGGFPRGCVSEVHGAISSGRTGLLLSVVARSTRFGALCAWVDPMDRLDPSSASRAGVDLERLLWLRGDSLAKCFSALTTLLGSGLFEVIVLDLGGVRDLGRLPQATWIRLQRVVESTLTALVLLAENHVARGPGGVSLSLAATGPRWSGSSPGRLLGALASEARTGHHGMAPFVLRAFV